MSENPYENLFNKDNSEDVTENSEDIASVTPEIEEIPVEHTVPEYSIAYTEPSEREEEVTDSVSAPAAAKAQVQNSYEWYGSTPVTEEVPSAPYAPYSPPQSSQKSERKKEKGRTPVALILILCILLSSVFGAGSAYLYDYFTKEDEKKSEKPSGGLTINQVVPEENSSDEVVSDLSTVQIVERAADSVVEITTESVKTGSFAQQYIESGAGSGVIIDSTGYIVTNHHVIDGAQKITVTLRSGESYDAKLIGSDSRIDLALLKIDGEELTAALFGNSDTLKVGQRTVAIGNPLGQLGGSVTEGIISALDRDVVVDGQTMNLLQTDTAINPGNSGGGLFDGQGTLIGIVVAKSSGSEVEGLGFAIPVNDALDVISDLKQYGYVRGRVNAGMDFIDVDSVQLAWMYGLSDLGCYVYSVDRNSNAEDAGFKSGDLIISVDGQSVESSEDIEAVLNQKSVGDEIEFSVKRNNSMGELTLILEEDVPDSLHSFGDNQNNPNW